MKKKITDATALIPPPKLSERINKDGEREYYINRIILNDDDTWDEVDEPEINS